MKAPVAKGRAANGKIPESQLASDDATERLPLGSDRLAKGDDDLFEDVPTVADRTRPMPEVRVRSEPASLASGKRVGTYRIVRPTTSDVIAAAIAQNAEAAEGKRVPSGATRKRR